MRHNVLIDGHAFRLRPVSDDDAEFIVNLRRDAVLGRFLHQTSESIERQLVWLAEYYDRSDDWYFVIERRSDKAREGMISLYDLDVRQGAAEWGRWILRRGSLSAVESALLIYRFAFSNLRLNEVFCRTIAANEAVVSFHDSCGITERNTLRNHLILNGCRQDVIEHRVGSGSWHSIEDRLESMARRIASRMKCDV